MRAIEDLEHEHLELMVLARALSGYLQFKTPPPAPALFQVRTKLASVLLRHLKTEDWILYPQMMQSGHRDSRETACKLQEQIGSLADAFRIHMECWSALTIENDWTAYRHEATMLLEELERRIRLEEERLYPLAKQIVCH